MAGRKHAYVATSVDNLGDQFHPARRAGWLTYKGKIHPAEAVRVTGPALGQGPSIVGDNEGCGATPRVHKAECLPLLSFSNKARVCRATPAAKRAVACINKPA